MSSYQKVKLSASTDGSPINCASTSTVIHTASVASIDEIWLWAVNATSAQVQMTVFFGGVAAKDTMIVPVPAYSGAYLMIPGCVLTNGLSVTALSAGGAIQLVGFVNRINP